jgi:hypothetical protein
VTCSSPATGAINDALTGITTGGRVKDRLAATGDGNLSLADQCAVYCMLGWWDAIRGRGPCSVICKDRVSASVVKT